MIAYLCAVPLLSALLSVCDPAPPLAVGYVEGEFVLVAPIETARILSLGVQRGDRVAADQHLVQLEQRDADIAVAQSRAALAEASSRLDDLGRGKRPDEIAVIAASLDSATAQAREAERVLKRQADLLRRGTTSRASHELAATNLELAKAKVAELEAALAVARLPARPEEIKAAAAAVDQARATVENAEWRRRQRALVALRPGRVFDIIRYPGEVAGPQAPVISLLPDGAVKLRLYVAEPDLSRVAPGTRLRVHCDGCGDGMTATVNYVAADPEFTPPVLYSLQNRQKLVYLVEARPDADALALKPGQIVDVDLAGPPS